MSKVIVIGAGIIGVTAASLLRQRGADVTVLEAAPSPAMGTSFANAGELSYGYSAPWASPGLLWKVPGMLLDKNGPLRIAPATSSLQDLVFQLRWLRWFGLNTTKSRYARNRRRILALSKQSKIARAQYFDLDTTAFFHQTRGTLQLFRSQESFDSVLEKDVPGLHDAGIAFEPVDANGCVLQEPGLSGVAESLSGGILFTDDETGDCHAFTQMLAGVEASNGVKFAYGTRVTDLVIDKHGVQSVNTNRGSFAGDAVVLCTGPDTPAMVRSLGLIVPIYGVRGYSMTVPVLDTASTVQSTILDEKTKIAITRLGDAVRVGGTAGIVPRNSPADPRRHDLLARSFSALFPTEIGSGVARKYWHGHRPMTPDGTPIIGPTICKNLWMNCGHGTLGWTQSFASAELLADLMSGQVPSLDPKDYALARYGARLQPARTYFLGPDVSPTPVNF